MGLLPSSMVSLLGEERAEQGVLRLHWLLQDPTLVRHLYYSLLDSLLLQLFPGLRVHSRVAVVRPA